MLSSSGAMAKPSLAQALRNAIAGEEAAARFYASLSAATSDPDAQQTLDALARTEVEHAARIRELGTRLQGDRLPELADDFAKLIETAPGWELAEDVSTEVALRLALEAETHASLFYEAVADAFTGADADVFLSLAETERSHAETIRRLLAKRTARS